MADHLSIKHSPVSEWLQYHFLEKKLNTPFGWLFLAVLGMIMLYYTVLVDYRIGPAVVVSFGFVLILILILKYPFFGFYFLISFSSVTTTIDRLVDLPVASGIFVDILLYFELISVISKHRLKKNIDRRFWSNPVSISLIALFAYYLIELFNPAMLGPLGWLSFIRKQVSYLVFFYICYGLLDTRARIIYFVRFMIVLSTLLAMYACKQQWFGYAGFELRAIGTGSGLALLLQGGLLRKFSVFSDPATSGILFAAVSMICIILFIRTDNRKERGWLAPAALFNLLGYSYSGTRTATMMIIVGITLYCLSTLNERKTIHFLGFSLTVFAFLFLLPYQNPITSRIRSTFEGTQDESAALRDYNRHQVQPYIQDHPIGGGIYTCGFEGPKYNEGHYLEFLQPDSGYMKTLAEQGAIGLFLLLAFYFVLMRLGFYYFFRVKDPEIRNYYIALLIMMFTLIVAQYAQMAITQSPVILFFYAILVIFIKLADFDIEPHPIKTTLQN